MKTFFLIVSVIFFVVSIQNLLKMKKIGIFPPKQILKKRASTFALSGIGCLVLAVIFTYL